jgi:TolB-like protein
MASPASDNFHEPQDINDDIRDNVLSQLELIRENKLFRDTTRMKRFLSYVVNEALEGRADRLKGYTIGLEVFDRPDDFDPQADTIVRVQAGQLRRRLDVYYSSDGMNDPVRIVIPKGQYAPTFEMRKPVSNSIDDFENMESLQLGQSLTDNIVQLHLKTRPGIAVLTFDDLGGNDDSNYFVEGLTAEIVNALVQFRYLRIVSRLPTVSGRNEAIDIKVFSKNYDVQFILSGSVRRVNDVFRVSVNLISAVTGEHIFTKIFDKQYSPENIFELQEEIASYTAAKVAAPFGVVNRYNRRSNLARAQNMPAYEALLKFYDVKLSPTMRRGKDLSEEFKAITENTPNFSSAWAIRGILNVLMCTQAIPVEAVTEKLEEAIIFGERATKIDPDNALGFMSLFMTNFHLGQFVEAEQMAQKSMALNPNDYSMLAYYAIANAFRNETDQAVSYQSVANSLIDNPPIWFQLVPVIVDIRQGRFKAVIERFDEMTPENSAGVHFFGLAAMGHNKMISKAKTLIEASRVSNPNYDKQLRDVFLLWQPDDELRDIVFKGWRLAGLDI